VLPNETTFSNRGEAFVLATILGVTVVTIVYMAAAMVYELFATFQIGNF
jgi:hypothetical protein